MKRRRTEGYPDLRSIRRQVTYISASQRYHILHPQSKWQEETGSDIMELQLPRIVDDDEIVSLLKVCSPIPIVEGKGMD